MRVRSTAPAQQAEPHVSWRRPVALVAIATVLALVPLEGPLAWTRFALCSAFVAAAVLSRSDGRVLAAAGLFAAIALKDGIPVVPGAFVGAFHVVLAGSVAAALVTAWRARSPLTLRLTPLEWALGALPLAALWSLPGSLSPEATLAALGRLLMLWAAALVVSRSLREASDVTAVLRAFALAAVPIALLAVVQWAVPSIGIGIAGGQPGAATINGRPAGFYFDPNFLGAHLTLAAMAALWLVGSSTRRWLWQGVALMLLAVVALTFSRSAWVATLVWVAVTMVFAASRTRVATSGVVALAVLAGAIALGPAAVIDRARSVFDSAPNASNATRVQMGKASLAMIADRPVAGTGLGAFDVAYPAYRLPGADPDITHPHQVPIALIAETGVGGVAALLALLAAGGVAARSALRGRAAYGGAAVAGVLALGVGSFFQYFLYFEVGWLFVGLLAACARMGQEATLAAPAPSGA